MGEEVHCVTSRLRRGWECDDGLVGGVVLLLLSGRVALVPDDQGGRRGVAGSAPRAGCELGRGKTSKCCLELGQGKAAAEPRTILKREGMLLELPREGVVAGRQRRGSFELGRNHNLLLLLVEDRSLIEKVAHLWSASGVKEEGIALGVGSESILVCSHSIRVSLEKTHQKRLYHHR